MKMRKRPRRLRETAGLRAMVREHHVRVDDLVYPLFVCSGTDKQEPVPSMPVSYTHLDVYKRQG